MMYLWYIVAKITHPCTKVHLVTVDAATQAKKVIWFNPKNLK
jgi:hypothetical protein